MILVRTNVDNTKNIYQNLINEYLSSLKYSKQGKKSAEE